MAAVTREAALTALVSLIGGSYAWASPVSRRLKLWDDVPLSSRPCAFVFEGGGERYEWREQRRFPIRCHRVDLVAYIDAHDQSAPGATQINNILDALDAAFEPSGPDIVTGRQTLGGSVFHARLDGQIRTTPGDIDGDGMLWAQIELVLQAP